MAKVEKLIKFFTVCAVVFVVLGYICRELFKFIWNFDIFNRESYRILYDYWENGGVFNTFRDCSLGLFLFLMPVIWLVLSYKLYKYGLVKFLLNPLVKLYRRITRPKTMEVEHVSIKNLGGQDKTLDEIIAEKVEKQGGNKSAGHASQNLRRQIAAKIEENEKQ